MTELERLAARCKAEVITTFHPHAGEYRTVQEYVEDKPGDTEHLPEGYKDWTDLVEIQFYPATPIGSYLVFAQTLDDAVRLAHECLDDNHYPGATP